VILSRAAFAAVAMLACFYAGMNICLVFYANAGRASIGIAFMWGAVVLFVLAAILRTVLRWRLVDCAAVLLTAAALILAIMTRFGLRFLPWLYYGSVWSDPWWFFYVSKFVIGGLSVGFILGSLILLLLRRPLVGLPAKPSLLSIVISKHNWLGLVANIVIVLVPAVLVGIIVSHVGTEYRQYAIGLHLIAILIIWSAILVFTATARWLIIAVDLPKASGLAQYISVLIACILFYNLCTLGVNCGWTDLIGCTVAIAAAVHLIWRVWPVSRLAAAFIAPLVPWLVFIFTANTFQMIWYDSMFRH
jgi:hypothetical protein